MEKCILLSIHQKFAELIISGIKKYEYRKIMPTANVSHIALYCTSPVQKIVAIVEVVSKITDTPSQLWKTTSREGGVSKKYFKQYFSGRKSAKAFKLGKVTLLDRPVELDRLRINNPPQSFRYLSSDDIGILFSRDVR